MKKFGFSKSAFCKALRTFSASVGITAVCMLATVSLLGLDEPPAQPAWQAPPGAQAAAAFGEAATPATTQAQDLSSHSVVPMGQAFGIKLFTDGVIVASLSDIYTTQGVCCPAAQAGLRPGDYLVSANGVEIENNAALASYIGKSNGQSITFLVRRNGQDFEATVTPVFGEGSFKTGMWVRDSAAGVGTLTFYDPATGCFAGLGHGICDSDAGHVMELKSGEPAGITLCGIVRGAPERPGQLQGYFSSDDPMGSLLANNETGVYGQLYEAPQGQPVEVLPRNQVHPGPVEILASIDQAGPRLYEGEIVEISGADQPTRNLVVRVTDPVLLQATGGIVQGMSGSCILQNGKVAGAVTHVFTDDPTMGYGIFAETMLEQCRKASENTGAAA